MGRRGGEATEVALARPGDCAERLVQHLRRLQPSANWGSPGHRLTAPFSLGIGACATRAASAATIVRCDLLLTPHGTMPSLLRCSALR